LNLLSLATERAEDNRGDLLSKEGWHSVSNLYILLGSTANEEVVVWKRLDSCRLSDSQASTLNRIVVNEVVSIFRNVASDSRSRSVGQLHSVAVCKVACMPIQMFGREDGGKLIACRGSVSPVSLYFPETRTKQVAVKIRLYVAAGFMIAYATPA